MWPREHYAGCTENHPRPNTLLFFFFNDTPTTEIYTLSLHDALPICSRRPDPREAHLPHAGVDRVPRGVALHDPVLPDRRLLRAHLRVGLAAAHGEIRVHRGALLPVGDQVRPRVRHVRRVRVRRGRVAAGGHRPLRAAGGALQAHDARVAGGRRPARREDRDRHLMRFDPPSLLKRYVWDDDKTPYLVRPERMSAEQAWSELFAYTVLLTAGATIVALGALAGGALGGPVAGLYAVTVGAAALLLGARGHDLAARYCVSAPAMLAIGVLADVVRPGMGFTERLVLLIGCALWLAYACRAVRVARRARALR